MATPARLAAPPPPGAPLPPAVPPADRGSPWLAAAFALALAVTGAAGCASRGPAPEPIRPGWSETGLASWYGPGFHGRPTASGERYDMEAMTAAHPWLPFGTVVRVENRESRNAAVVRINDRGPFKRGRILDVSRAAARELGLLGPGTAEVRLTVVEMARGPGCLELQVGAFGDARNVRAAVERARALGYAVRRETGPDDLTRVLVGPFEAPEEADRARGRLGGIVRACPSS